MIQLAGWSIFISVIHGLFPNHWMPTIAFGKSNNWSNAKSLKLTSILAGVHIFSTVVFGILIYWMGTNILPNHHFFELLTSWGFIIFGVLYFSLSGHLSDSGKQKTKNLTLAYLALLMLFSPCIEILPFFFNSSEFGFEAFIMVAVIYAIFSLLGIMIMAYFGLKAMEKLEQNLFIKKEKYIISGVFLIVGILNFFIE